MCGWSSSWSSCHLQPVITSPGGWAAGPMPACQKCMDRTHAEAVRHEARLHQERWDLRSREQWTVLVISRGERKAKGELKCTMCLLCTKYCVVLRTFQIFPLLIPCNSLIKQIFFTSFLQMKKLRPKQFKLSYLIQEALGMKPILSDSKFHFLSNYGFQNSIHRCFLSIFTISAQHLYFYVILF